MAHIREILKYGFQHTKGISEQEFLFHAHEALKSICDSFGLFPDTAVFTLDKSKNEYVINQDANFRPSRILDIRLDEDREEYGTNRYNSDVAVTTSAIAWTPPQSFLDAHDGRKVYIVYSQVPRDPDEIPDVVLQEFPYVVAYGALSRMTSKHYNDERKNWRMDYEKAMAGIAYRFSRAAQVNSPGGNVFRLPYWGGL